MYPRAISASFLVLSAVFLVLRASSLPASAQDKSSEPADLSSSVVPPGVRAEVRRRLQDALSDQVAPSLPAVGRTDKQARNDAAFCNTGRPYRGYSPADGSRADACGHSRDLYKACDLDITGKWCDTILMSAAPTDGEAGIFVQGHPERPEWLNSLAFVEEAANCRGNCMARAISYFGGPAGVPFAMADWPLTKWSTPTTGESRSQLILGRSDEIWFYTRMCPEQGIRGACPHLSELGVPVNEETVATANRRQAEIDQEAILERDLEDQKVAAETAKWQQHLERMNSLGGALDAANSALSALPPPPPITAPAAPVVASATSSSSPASQGGSRPVAPSMSSHSSPAQAQDTPAPSSSATTSSSTTASASYPSLVPPHDNLCIAQFYDANHYNWLSIRNDCSEPVHLAFQSRNYPSAVFGAMDLSAGQTANTGHSQAEIKAAGGILLYVCPLHYTPVDQTRNAIGADRPVGLFACQSQ